MGTKAKRADYKVYYELRQACDILEAQHESFKGKYSRGETTVRNKRGSLMRVTERIKTRERAVDEGGGLRKITKNAPKKATMRIRKKRYFIPSQDQKLTP